MIIAAQPRVGTHMVRTALNTHPSIHVHTEIFNGNLFAGSLAETTAPMLVANHADFCLHVFDPCDLEGRWPWWSRQLDLYDMLREEELPAVILTRRNKLLQAISYIRAERTGIYHRMRGPSKRNEIICPPWQVISLIEQFERADAYAHELFSHAKVFVYEDFLHDPVACYERLQCVFGLPYRDDMRPQTHRLSKQPLADSIENYEILSQALAGTRHEHYLESVDA